jgi:hypothetical protein
MITTHHTRFGFGVWSAKMMVASRLILKVIGNFKLNDSLKPSSLLDSLLAAGISLSSAHADNFTTSLSAVPDTMPPTLVRASGFGNGFSVNFSEPVDPTTAQAETNYALTNARGPVVITSAQLCGESNVLLTTASPLPEGMVHGLTVNRVTDTAQTPNAIAPNSTISFSPARPSPFRVVGPERGRPMQRANRFKWCAGHRGRCGLQPGAQEQCNGSGMGLQQRWAVRCAMNLTGVIVLAANSFLVPRGLALKTDGTLVPFGLDASPVGLFTVTRALQGVVAVAAGGNHTLALVRLDSVFLSTFSGMVLDCESGSPLTAATVEIAGSKGLSNEQGNFRFSSVRPGEYTLQASKAGYALFSGTIAIPPGTDVRRNICLFPTNSTNPRVTDITSKFPGFSYFLDGVSTPVSFTATVDWAGHQPGKVRFFTPRGVFDIRTSSSTATRSFDMGLDLGPGGKLRAEAVSSDGTSSPDKEADLVVMPSPGPVDLSALLVVSDRGDSFVYF